MDLWVVKDAIRRSRMRDVSGLNTDDPVWVPTVFTHNRDRLLEGEDFNPLDTPS